MVVVVEKIKVYADNAATTRVDPKVVEAMLPYFTEKYGNASSLHEFGTDAREALEKARESVAKAIGAQPEETIFTSGGTESDNAALKGAAFANRSNGKHIITCKIEHHAILHTCEWLQKQGFEVTYLPVDKYGLVDPADVEQAIRKDTILVSIMHANNEIGTIEPIEEIAKICNEKSVYFHTDAVQTFGKIRMDLGKTGINMLSASSHKLNGPKGAGLLYVRKGTKIDPLMHGGGHEKGKRSGTENLPGIVGFAKATEIAAGEMESETKRLTDLRNYLTKEVLKIEDSCLNGHPAKRLAGNANFSFKYIEGESLLMYLNDLGIAASTGSACSSKSLEPSHVLLAIGLKPEEAHGSLRVTLGKYNTREEAEYIAAELPGIVGKLRQMSPFKRK